MFKIKGVPEEYYMGDVTGDSNYVFTEGETELTRQLCGAIDEYDGQRDVTPSDNHTQCSFECTAQELIIDVEFGLITLMFHSDVMLF